jgi:hypothetical protein
MSGSSNGSLAKGGSRGRTSIPAPPSRPALRAAARAEPSTKAPRAVLINNASGFMSASSRAPIKPRVESSSGQCSETMSETQSSCCSSVRSGRGISPQQFAGDHPTTLLN